MWTDYSKRFTQRRLAVWGSDCPSVAPLSRVIMAAYGPHRTMVQEPRFPFLFLAYSRLSRAPGILALLGRSLWPIRNTYEEFVMAMRSLVSVVDDDESVRESLPDLLRQFGFVAQAFSSAEAVLGSGFLSQTHVLLF